MDRENRMTLSEYYVISQNNKLRYEKVNIGKKCHK